MSSCEVGKKGIKRHETRRGEVVEREWVQFTVRESEIIGESEVLAFRTRIEVENAGRDLGEVLGER